MAEVTIKKIPAHIVYSAEFDIRDFIDFFAHGVPTLAIVMLTTEEGREGAKELAKSVLSGINDKFGPAGVAAAFCLASIFLVPVVLITSKTVIISTIIDVAKDLFEKVSTGLTKFFTEACNFVSDFVGSIVEWFKSRDAGHTYASHNPRIIVNTGELVAFGDRLKDLSTRLKRLDSRIQALRWRTSGLFGGMQFGKPLDDDARMLLKCATYLYDTARYFEDAERDIASYFS